MRTYSSFRHWRSQTNPEGWATRRGVLQIIREVHYADIPTKSRSPRSDNSYPEVRLFYASGWSRTLLVVGVHRSAVVVTVVHSFNSSGLSANPQYVTPAQGRDAKLYGTTQGTSLDFGSIFRLQTTGANSDLYSFDGTQGEIPDAGLTARERWQFLRYNL